MGIFVDINKENVNVAIMYIEEKKQHGNAQFRFIKSEDELKEWREKGFKLETEIAATLPNQTAMPNQPGVPNQIKRDENKIVHVLHTSWRRMTWKDQNEIWSKCLKQITDGQGKSRTELDGITYRDLKLKTCLKKWNIKNDAGEDIPVSSDNIDKLIPEVALEMLETFERITESSE